MRTTSVFCAQCICGLDFETPEREFICPKCNRLIVLEWGATDEKARTETPDKTSEAEAAA